MNIYRSQSKDLLQFHPTKRTKLQSADSSVNASTITNFSRSPHPVPMDSEPNAQHLLNQFELILDSDPLIDEVGFVHPSQFATLGRSNETLLNEHEAATHFWNRDHKLGISTHVVIPLYRAAKDACWTAINKLKFENDYDSNVESDVMKHSKAVLLLSCDLGTAWNSRKLIVARKQHMSLFIDELRLSALVLSYSPKSEQAWCHRRWVIKMIYRKCSTLQEILEKESELVEKIAERSKMNYRAWNHRCWLVSYMTREQVLNELMRSRNWAGLHVADNSCFHYHTQLMLKLLEECSQKQADKCLDCNSEMYRLWQEEIGWNEVLIKRYVGREALWLYRRFLSLCWIRNFATALGDISTHYGLKSSIEIYLDNELRLVDSCSTLSDSDFEDYQAQAIYSATYILWLAKQIPKAKGVELQEKLGARSMKTRLDILCPERSFLWCNLTGHPEASDQDSKETES